MPLSYNEIMAMPSGPEKTQALAEYMDQQLRGGGRQIFVGEPPLEPTPIVPPQPTYEQLMGPPPTVSTPTEEFFKYEDIVRMEDPEQQKAEMAKRIAKAKGWDIARATEAATDWQRKHRKIIERPSIAGIPKITERKLPLEQRPLKPIAPAPGAPGAKPGVGGVGVSGKVKTGVAKSGVRDPAKLAELQEAMKGQRGDIEQRIREYLAPYETMQSEFAKLTPEEKEFLGVTDISEAAPSPQDEYAQLAAKPKKSLAEMSRMQQLAIDMAAQTGKARASEETGYLEQHEEDLKDIEARNQAKQEIRTRMMDDEMGKLRDAQKLYESASVDPMKHFKDPGKAVMSFIGLALGALGQYFQSQHGRKAMPNMAILALNKAVDQNIDAQKVEITKLGKRVDMQYNAVAMMRSLFKDEALADEAAKIALTQLLGRQLDLVASRYKGQETEDRAREAKALLEQQNAQNMLNFQLKLDDSILKRLELEERAASHRESMKLGWAQLAAMKARSAMVKPRLISEKTAKELGAWEGASDAVAALGEAHKALKGEGFIPDVIAKRWPGYLSATNANNYNKMVKPVIADIIRSFSGAQVTDKEREWFMEMMPDAGDTAQTGMRKIEAMMDFLYRKHDYTLTGLGKAEFHLGKFEPLEAQTTGQGKPTY